MQLSRGKGWGKEADGRREMDKGKDHPRVLSGTTGVLISPRRAIGTHFGEAAPRDPATAQVTDLQRCPISLFDSLPNTRKALSQISCGEEQMQAVDEAVGLFFSVEILVSLLSCRSRIISIR